VREAIEIRWKKGLFFSSIGITVTCWLTGIFSCHFNQKPIQWLAFASFSGFHGNVTLHCHWKYSLLALLQPCSGGVSLQNFAQNRLNCEYVTLSRQTNSTRIAKHRSFIKLKFLQNFCSSCKTLADQVARNTRFYCICFGKFHDNGENIRQW
jgi:hypothetical protein